MLVRVVTQNDSNGNPRRGWIQFSDCGDMTQFIDEGYKGRSMISDLIQIGEMDTLALNITPKEYNRLKKLREVIK